MTDHDNEARTDRWPPPGWSRHDHDYGGRSHTYYIVDRTSNPLAPRVLLLHEFPGISANLRELADTLSADFRTFVPSLIGRDGNPSLIGSAIQLCIRREIYIFAIGRTSPAVAWVRSLADRVVAEPPHRTYGVIGMCMTGGFALALAVDPRAQATVVAQPALPFARLMRHIPLPRSKAREHDVGLSDEDRDQLLVRIANDPQQGCIRALRYRQDWISPPARMAKLVQLVGQNAIATFTLDEPYPTSHSTLTGPRRSPAAVEDLKDYLYERLVGRLPE